MIYSERLQTFLHAMDRPDEYWPEDGGRQDASGMQGAYGLGVSAMKDMDRQDASGMRKAGFFESLRLKAEADQVPIIRREMESFLQVLLELKKPADILEVGSATGYSAMRMASFTPDFVQITTIEKDALRAASARSNFQKSEWAQRISLIEGDALEALKVLESGAYDFIFMDAAKGQYIHFLPEALRVLKTGGVLVSDNVLQDGMILEPHTAVDPRDRTIYQRMRTYLRVLKRTDGLLTSIVPVGDGASVTIKRKEICIDREQYLNF